jgi:dihydrofolate synthase/folylpolyglutamate synthase
VAEPVANVTEGLQRALLGPGPAPHVLICGGLHFAGEVLAMSPETWPT